jgi:hypothetical protein
MCIHTTLPYQLAGSVLALGMSMFKNLREGALPVSNVGVRRRSVIMFVRYADFVLLAVNAVSTWNLTEEIQSTSHSLLNHLIYTNKLKD